MNKKINFSSLLKKANSLTDIFNYYKKNFPEKKFLFKKEKNNWKGKSFFNIGLNIEKISSSLKKLDVKKGDRVFLLSSNRIEWVEFDIAIMQSGGITVPSFVTNNISDNKFIIKDCEPKVIIFENEKIYLKNKVFLKNFDHSKIVIIEKTNKFLDYNKIISQKNYKYIPPKIKKDDLSTIIYTSGTSGNPKGVVLSHKALIHNLFAALQIIEDFKIDKERFISFLPLSHSYERVAGLYFPLLINGQIFFCTSLDKLMKEIKEVQPTIFSGVPRLFENIFKKIKGQIRDSGLIKKFILRTVFNYIEEENSKIINVIFGKFFINIFLKNKIKKTLGGRIKALISGGAALNPKIGLFFNKVGLNLLQGYGQTEAAPLISCNLKQLNDPKTVGFPVKNVKIKISDDNEILIMGDNVMNGYWRNKRLTKRTIINKWLHTGDLGYLDELGRIVINGRKKDLIITSGGDNISVQRIEYLLSKEIEINQAIIFGDNKPYLIALLVLENKKYRKSIKEIINKINNSLNSIEKIRKFMILEKQLTYENGFLTQTQKIKREKVFESYKKEIENLYS